MSARGKESRLGATLVNAGLLDARQMNTILAEHQRRGGPLPPIIVEMGFASGAAIARTISTALRIPSIDLGPRFMCEPQVASCVEPGLAAAELVVPYALRDKGATLWLAMADPTDDETVVKVTKSSMKRVRAMVAACDDLQDALKRIYGIGSAKMESIELDENEDSGSMVITDVTSDTAILEVTPGAMPAVEAPDRTPLVPTAPPPGMTPHAGSPALNGLSEAELERLKALRESQREASKILRAVLDLCVEKGVIALEEYKLRSRGPTTS